MNECVQTSELLMWQVLFLAMSVIALVLAFMAYPASRGFRRAVMLMWKRKHF